MSKRKRQPTQPMPDVVPACVNVPVECVPTQPDLAGLAAGDAEIFDCMAAAKRASAVGTDPVWAAQANAEASGLEALAASLRNPVARGLPSLQQGQGGETAPPESCDHSWRAREMARVVAAPSPVQAGDASLDRLCLAQKADVLNMAVELAQDVGGANGELANHAALTPSERTFALRVAVWKSPGADGLARLQAIAERVGIELR